MLRHSLLGCFAVITWLLSQGPAPGQSVRDSNTSAIDAEPEQPLAGTPDLQQVRQLIFADVNGFRAREKRLPVRVNPKLAETADYFAHYLARTDKFSHTADGKEPWERAAAHSYSYCIVLENIAYEYNSEGFTAAGLADTFVQGWEHSPGHRRNMLDPDVVDTGIGVARSKAGYYYAVQMFGRPHADAIVFRVINRTDATVQFALDKQKESIRPGYTMTYTRCRPSEVDFRPAGKEQAFHPKSGARLVLEPAQAGGYRVRENQN